MSLSSWRSFMKCPLIICKAFRQISMSAFLLFTSGTPGGNTPLSSVAFAFPEKCSAERTLAEESSEYDLTGATLAVLSRGSAKEKSTGKAVLFSLVPPAGILRLAPWRSHFRRNARLSERSLKKVPSMI